VRGRGSWQHVGLFSKVPAYCTPSAFQPCAPNLRARMPSSLCCTHTCMKDVYVSTSDLVTTTVRLHFGTNIVCLEQGLPVSCYRAPSPKIYYFKIAIRAYATVRTTCLQPLPSTSSALTISTFRSPQLPTSRSHYVYACASCRRSKATSAVQMTSTIRSTFPILW
jgi:hypothetical protein